MPGPPVTRRRATRRSGSDIVTTQLDDGSFLDRSMNKRRRVSRRFASNKAKSGNSP